MSSSEYVHSAHNVSNLVYHFVSTVGKNVNENTIREYVKNQGTQNSYKQLYFKM
jgi:REP element-mobilizing transposase RayT